MMLLSRFGFVALALLFSVVCASSGLAKASTKVQIPFQRVVPRVETEPIYDSEVYGVRLITGLAESEAMEDDDYAVSIQKRGDPNSNVTKYTLSGSYVRYVTDVNVFVSSTTTKTFKAIIDTGNSVTALPVIGCNGCSTMSPLFPNETSPVFCSSESCNGNCSSTSPLLCDASQELSNGLVFRGYRTSGNVALSNMTVNMFFQAIEYQKDRNLVNDVTVDGVLSFSHGDDNPTTDDLPTYLDIVAQKYGVAPVFTLTLTNSTGTLTLGGIDDTVTGPYFYTPLVLPASFVWQIRLSYLNIGGQTIRKSQLAQVESASSTIQLEDSIYQSFQQSVQAQYPDLPGVNGTTSVWNGLCFSNMTSLAGYPTLTVGFETFALVLSPFDYFFPAVDKTTNATSYCLGITRGGLGVYLGDTFLRAFSTTFDEQKHRVGFAVSSFTSQINYVTEEDGGLSTGAKVGIAIGVIVGVVLIIVVVVMLMRRPQNPDAGQKDPLF